MYPENADEGFWQSIWKTYKKFLEDFIVSILVLLSFYLLFLGLSFLPDVDGWGHVKPWIDFFKVASLIGILAILTFGGIMIVGIHILGKIQSVWRSTFDERSPVPPPSLDGYAVALKAPAVLDTTEQIPDHPNHDELRQKEGVFVPIKPPLDLDQREPIEVKQRSDG